MSLEERNGEGGRQKGMGKKERGNLVRWAHGGNFINSIFQFHPTIFVHMSRADNEVLTK